MEEEDEADSSCEKDDSEDINDCEGQGDNDDDEYDSSYSDVEDDYDDKQHEDSGPTGDGDGDGSGCEEDRNFENEEDLIRDLKDATTDDNENVNTPWSRIWNGYKFELDNIDFNVIRSFQRSDRTTQSHHYCHTFALHDPVDLSSVSDEPSVKPIVFENLLPSPSDILDLKKTFTTLVSRILVDLLPEMNHPAKDVVWHIPHPYQNEMAKKSTVVPLGVIMRNENKLDQMCLILDELQKYCPTTVENVKVKLPDGKEIDHRMVKAYEIGLGGDQLTCARVRGAQGLRRTHDCTDHQLKTYIPFVEDWHSRLTLVTVIWVRMFNKQTLAMRDYSISAKTKREELWEEYSPSKRCRLLSKL